MADKRLAARKATNEQIIEAFNASWGGLAKASRYLKEHFDIDITRQGLYSLCLADQELKDAQRAAREGILDACEEVVFDYAAEIKDPKAAMEILKRLGRKRGWDGKSDNVVIPLSVAEKFNETFI